MISIRFCDDTLIPSPSRRHDYPFDDDDTVAFATFLASGRPSDAYCRDQMASYKIPRKIMVTDSLPRVHGWKLLRRELRDKFSNLQP